jgi:membrane protease YdiL (CAAX protease family)
LLGGPALLGVGLGVVLWFASETGSRLVDAAGIEHDESLRGLLAPESTAGWLALLVVVLPVIAGVEELVFRAAAIGVVSAGLGVSPWAMAVVSSVGFALGHGAQGTAGVVVTGLLGLVLAAAFVLTGSLLTVFVAHYLVNALEFLVHEGAFARPTG